MSFTPSSPTTSKSHTQSPARITTTHRHRRFRPDENKRTSHTTTSLYVHSTDLSVQVESPIPQLPALPPSSHAPVAPIPYADRLIDVWKCLVNVFEGDAKEAIEALDQTIKLWQQQDDMEVMCALHYSWSWYAHDMMMMDDVMIDPSTIKTLSKKQQTCLRYVAAKYAGLITPSPTPSLPTSPHVVAARHMTTTPHTPASPSATSLRDGQAADEISQLLSKLKAEAIVQDNLNVTALEHVRHGLVGKRSSSTPKRKQLIDENLDEKYVGELVKRMRVEAGGPAHPPSPTKRLASKDDVCHECGVIVIHKGKLVTNHFGGPAKCCTTCKRYFCRSCLCKTHDYNIVALATSKAKEWTCPHCQGHCFSSPCIAMGRILCLSRAFHIKLPGNSALKHLQHAWFEGDE